MIKSKLESFLQPADDKAEAYGWGTNYASLIETHEVVRVTATQGEPQTAINHSFRVDGDALTMEEFAALLD